MPFSTLFESVYFFTDVLLQIFLNWDFNVFLTPFLLNSMKNLRVSYQQLESVLHLLCAYIGQFIREVEGTFLVVFVRGFDKVVYTQPLRELGGFCQQVFQLYVFRVYVFFQIHAAQFGGQVSRLPQHFSRVFKVTHFAPQQYILPPNAVEDPFSLLQIRHFFLEHLLKGFGLFVHIQHLQFFRPFLHLQPSIYSYQV